MDISKSLITTTQIKDELSIYYWINDNEISLVSGRFFKTKYNYIFQEEFRKFKDEGLNDKNVINLLININRYLNIPKKYYPEIVSIPNNITFIDNLYKKKLKLKNLVYKLIFKPALISYLEQFPISKLYNKDMPLPNIYYTNLNYYHLQNLQKGLDKKLQEIGYILKVILPGNKEGKLSNIKNKRLYGVASQLLKAKKNNVDTEVLEKKLKKELKELKNTQPYLKTGEHDIDLEEYRKRLANLLKSIQEHEKGLDFDDYINAWAKKLLNETKKN